MKGKLKSILVLLLLLIVTGGLIALSYYGIGKDRILGIDNISLGLDLRGGVYIVYEAEKESVTTDEMNSAVALMQQRLDRKNWTEAEVAQQGNKRIRVDIPGVEDADTAIKEIGQTAQLVFASPEGEVILTGNDVANATKDVTQRSQGAAPESCVRLDLNDVGKQAFAEATAKYINQPIHIILDETVISSPTVNSAITDGTAIITGSFTPESAEELAALIRSGSLPFNLTVVEMNNIGARLGIDAFNTSITAGIIGLILVVLFMIFFYRLSGFSADWALVIYVALELVVLSLFNVTLTLPGIAGIILSVGMAVDANVIIFERLKEELVLGKSLRASIKASYTRAFPAILDGNVTTLIAAGVLFYLGTGPIRGFAQTLIIGILLSMFTALFVTRTIVNTFIGLGIKSPRVFCPALKIKVGKEDSKDNAKNKTETEAVSNENSTK